MGVRESVPVWYDEEGEGDEEKKRTKWKKEMEGSDGLPHNNHVRETFR